MTTTQNAGQAEQIQQAKREIIEDIEDLSLDQLRETLAYINGLRGLPKGVSGAEYVAMMQDLREKHHITDEEFEEFDRILREGLEASKQIPPQDAAGEPFIARMRALRDEFEVTDEEFAEFDRILRESDEAEKRRAASSPHE